MEAALHDHDFFSLKCTEKQLSRVGFHSTLGKVRDVTVADFPLDRHFINKLTQAGALDDPDYWSG